MSVNLTIAAILRKGMNVPGRGNNGEPLAGDVGELASGAETREERGKGREIDEKLEVDRMMQMSEGGPSATSGEGPSSTQTANTSVSKQQPETPDAERDEFMMYSENEAKPSAAVSKAMEESTLNRMLQHLEKKEKNVTWCAALREWERRSTSAYLELDVGRSVDPMYLVGKRLKIHCPVDDRWYHGSASSYSEENGLHVITFEDGQKAKVPLPAFRVRLLHDCKNGFPPKPSMERMKQMVSTLEKSMADKTIKKGDASAVAEALERIKGDISRAIDDGGMTCTIYTENDSGFSPGQAVWSKFSKYPYWPGLVMTVDQITRESQCNVAASDEPYVAVYYFGTYEHYLSPSSLLKSVAEGLDEDVDLKGKQKRFLKALDEMQTYLKDGILPGRLLEKFDFVPSEPYDGQHRAPLKRKVTSVVRKPGARKQGEVLKGIAKYFAMGKSKISESVKGKTLSTSLPDSGETVAEMPKIPGLGSNAAKITHLGSIEYKNPNYHNKEGIFPSGYKIERNMKSVLSPNRKSWHTIEILAPADKKSKMEFRVSVKDNHELKGNESSGIFDAFLKSVECPDGFLSKSGFRLLALNRKVVQDAILSLPNASMCDKISQSLKKKIESLSTVTETVSGDPLLWEMERCQLPPGVNAIPMEAHRPFECQVCGEIEEDEDDFILQCDRCKCCVHMSCYGVKEAPHGELWLCDVCSVHPEDHQRPACALCPVSGGIMKRTTCNRWCHLACATWLPETALVMDKEHLHLKGLVDGLKGIHKSRFEAKCCICKQKYGACLQCCSERPECRRTFHFLCARNNRCTHQMLLDSDDEDENMNENQNGESSKDSGPGSGKSKKSTNSRKRKSRPGTRISGFRLVVNCPQHSGQILAPRRSSEAESNADIHPEKKRRTFAGKDIHSWLSLKHQVDKSAYIQPVGMSLGGPRTLRNSEGQSHCALPGIFDSKCIKFEDDTAHSIRDDEMVPGFLDIAAPERKKTTSEARNILSTAENFANMNKTWKKSVIPGKSAIHGWGAFATRKFAKDEMVIEYVGELVRPSVAEVRERRLYDKLVGAGTYVFRLNTSYCVDATRSGNLAHLLNHSCNPNCVSRTISVMDPVRGKPVDHVVIFALRDIQLGEELTYDYRFCGEEVLPCNCGTETCRKMVNQKEPDRILAVPSNELKRYNFQ